MKKSYLALMCAALLCLSSCKTKEKALNNLRDFTTELQTEGNSYSMSDWKKAAEKYKKVNQRLTKYQYTTDEMEEIGSLQGQCATAFASSLGNKVKGIGSWLKGLSGSLTDFLNFDLDSLFGK